MIIIIIIIIIMMMITIVSFHSHIIVSRQRLHKVCVLSSACLRLDFKII